MRTKTICISAALVIMLGLGFLIGTRYQVSRVAAVNLEPDIVYYPVEVERTRIIEVPVEVEVITEKLVEVVREVPIEVVREIEKVEYTALPNLGEWTYLPFTNENEIRTYARSTGIVERQYVPTTYDCDDFAIDFWKQSIEDNRLVGLLLVMHLTENNKIAYYHMMNFTLKGQYIYQIEPQTGNTWPIQGYDGAKLD